MYLFSRRAQAANGKFGEAVPWALEAAAAAAGAGGLPISTWLSILSPDVGGIGWSILAESIAQLHEATLKYQASAEFHAAVAKGAGLMTAPPVDVLAQILHGGPTADGPPALATVVRGTATPGHLASALAAGVELAQAVTSITGQSSIFLRNVTGDFGGVAWITGAASASAVDEANAKLAADASWLTLVDKAGAHFRGDTQSQMLQRLG